MYFLNGKEKENAKDDVKHQNASYASKNILFLMGYSLCVRPLVVASARDERNNVGGVFWKGKRIFAQKNGIDMPSGCATELSPLSQRLTRHLLSSYFALVWLCLLRHSHTPSQQRKVEFKSGYKQRKKKWRNTEWKGKKRKRKMYDPHKKTKKQKAILLWQECFSS